MRDETFWEYHQIKKKNYVLISKSLKWQCLSCFFLLRLKNIYIISQQVGQQILLPRNYNIKVTDIKLRSHLGNNYHPQIIKAADIL